MANIKELLRDDLLNKEQLILKRYKFLGLDEIQARFLSKIYADKNIDPTSLTMDDISKVFGVDKTTAETIMQELVSTICVSVKSDDNGMSFDFEILINRLVKTYFSPHESEDVETKLFWSINKIGFELTQENINDLKKMINSEDWNKLSTVIERTSENDDGNWPLFISLWNSLTVKDSQKNDHLKNVLDRNWLE